MKLPLALCLALCLLPALAAQAPAAPAIPAAPAEPSEADLNYAFGMILAANLKSTGLPIDLEQVYLGLGEAFAGKSTRLSQAQASQVIQAAFQAAQERKLAANLAAGKAYLAENAKRAGVKVTASGLQYEVLKAGTGAKPAATDTVTVHYEGRLIGGKVFDSSYQRGEPATFALDQVIKGWTEALQLMGVGAKYRIFLPSELAYGEEGAGDDIEPNSVLVFDVELVSIGAK